MKSPLPIAVSQVANQAFLSTISSIMTEIATKVDAGLDRWSPETAKKLQNFVTEIIELADHDALDIVRSRQVEQEVFRNHRWSLSRVSLLADLGLAAKTRPVLVLSRDDPDAPRALVTYVPLTTRNRNSRYEIYLGD